MSPREHSILVENHWSSRRGKCVHKRLQYHLKFLIIKKPEVNGDNTTERKRVMVGEGGGEREHFGL